MTKKKWLAAGGAAVLAGGLSLSATANAAVTPAVTYSNAGTNAVAGWFAHSLNQEAFTHGNSYIGSSGNSSLSSLPVSTPTDITGGAGLGFCDEASGQAAQVGVINIGGGKEDVVAATGTFGTVLQNGDPCENGVVNPTGKTDTAGNFSFSILLAGVSVNDTVDVDLQSNALVSFNGNPADSVAFEATDLAHPTETGSFVSPAFTGAVATEMDAGVIADTAMAPAITGTPVPASDAGTLARSAPNELVRFAHVKVSVNNNAPGGHESHGNRNAPLQAANTAWDTSPVVATQDGTPTGALFLDVSNFGADNFYIAGGVGIV
jgi:hypothetical protein